MRFVGLDNFARLFGDPIIATALGNNILYAVVSIVCQVGGSLVIAAWLTRLLGPRLGAFLRRSSLDELPQLINILRGEMSIVGPRPIVRQEVKKYGDFFGHYTAVRPGVTGLWQVMGRNDTTYDERVRLDAAYATSWSLKGDLWILLRTIPAVLLSRGAY
jgi:lipopolysaccharide/colanic/teichoic acid biosynthesis glycosyltransferase